MFTGGSELVLTHSHLICVLRPSPIKSPTVFSAECHGAEPLRGAVAAGRGRAELLEVELSNPWGGGGWLAGWRGDAVPLHSTWRFPLGRNVESQTRKSAGLFTWGNFLLRPQKKTNKQKT